jgi:shikimate dehydrogenase
MFNRQALVGLIGANIMKSLAPALHIDAFAAAGIAGHYHLMDVDQLPLRALNDLLQAVKTAGFLGVNITFPFKQQVIPLLDELSPEARQTGAVNTVTISHSGRTVGYNTDRSGFRLNFEDGLGRGRAEGRSAVLVGAGGAGSAVAFALMDLGLRTLIVHDTDTARAAALAADITAHFGAGSCRVSERAGSSDVSEPVGSSDVSDWLSEEIDAADGVVNATPIGMSGFPGNPVPVDALRAGHWVADVIYSPIETELIRAAAARNCQVLTGGGMCVHQAVDAFRLFTGITPDPARMHRVFAQALVRRDQSPEAAS